MKGKILILTLFSVIFLIVLVACSSESSNESSNESSSGEAASPDYPTKDITITVPFSAGDTTDLISRTFADFASEKLGQNVIVVNKAGGGGSIGHSEVARAKPDGYTLLLGSSGAITASPYMGEVSYTYEDFEPIGMLVENGNVIVTSKDSALETFDDFVKYAKENPGELEYATPGVGVSQHLMMERMSKKFDFEVTHIPHESGVNALAAVLGKHVDIAIAGANIFSEQIKSGEVKALGISVADSNLPDVETFENQGYEIDATVWFGLFVPKETPKSVREVLTGTLEEASKDPEVVDAFAKLKVHQNYLGPDEFLQKIEDNVSGNKEIIEELGLGNN